MTMGSPIQSLGEGGVLGLQFSECASGWLSRATDRQDVSSARPVG